MATPKKTKEEILAGMDEASLDARKEFTEMNTDGELDDGTLKSLAGWWERWYPTAGHKRLAHILMQEGGK